MDTAAANPYASSAAPVPVGPNVARVGIRFGLLFGMPFLLVAVLGLVAMVLAETRFPFESLPIAAFFLALGFTHCVCGWWWAVKTRRGTGWFLLTGVVMGTVLTLAVFGLIVMLILAAGGFRPRSFSGIGPALAFVIPVAIVWLTLMGTLVHWRIRVLERRLAASAVATP